MLNRKVFVFIMIGVLTCSSLFGQDITTVKEFEKARRTIPMTVTFNIFGFGIGSFLQGDTKNAFIQLGISTVGYGLLLTGIIGGLNRSTPPEGGDMKIGTSNALIYAGSSLLTGNAIFGTHSATMYQFNKKFDAFYDINNDVTWPGGF